MPTPERPKGPDSKGLDRKPISERLKTTLEEALRRELEGSKGRVMVTSHFVKFPGPDKFDINMDIDLEKPTR